MAMHGWIFVVALAIPYALVPSRATGQASPAPVRQDRTESGVVGFVVDAATGRPIAQAQLSLRSTVWQRISDTGAYDKEFDRILHAIFDKSTAPPLGDLLSPAERRVAEAVADGATNREVAAQLYVSVRTVEFHLGNIYRKLDVRSRTALAHSLRG